MTASSSSSSRFSHELKVKDSCIAALTAKLEKLEDELRLSKASVPPAVPLSRTNSITGAQYGSPTSTAAAQAASVTKRQHPLSSFSHTIHESGKRKDKVGTRGSLLTTNVLEAIEEAPKSKSQLIAERFLKVFQSPADFLPYLKSKDFANDLLCVTEAVAAVLEEEPRCMFLQSPVYVFGDIHGNLEDLHFFSDNLWRLGMDLTAGSFLFLGDYVDRGMSCLECVAYLFGLKLLYPKKISLLRGNHETRDVNGWEDHYAEKSFLFQCKDRFGVSLGEDVWEACNNAFDRLPLSAVIDHDIFCIHGGIPRPIEDFESEIQAILHVPNIASVMPHYEHEQAWQQQVATDCIWSDPAPEYMEPRLDACGFGDSPRGGGAVMFGSTAIDNFLNTNNLSYIIRAHEAHAHGVALSKSARVFTVFSTSKDHRQGSQAMAGCILVDVDRIQVINRSHKYKNKYVHRRTSISLENLSSKELEDRRKIGLVRLSGGSEDHSKAAMELPPKMDHYFPGFGGRHSLGYEMADENKPHNNAQLSPGSHSTHVPSF